MTGENKDQEEAGEKEGGCLFLNGVVSPNCDKARVSRSPDPDCSHLSIGTHIVSVSV